MMIVFAAGQFIIGLHMQGPIIHRVEIADLSHRGTGIVEHWEALPCGPVRYQTLTDFVSELESNPHWSPRNALHSQGNTSQPPRGGD